MTAKAVAFISAGIIAACPACNPGSAKDFVPVMGTNKIAAAMIPRPARGVQSVDSGFGLPVARISDLHADKYAPPGITNEYSRHDPSNCDGSLLVLHEPATGNWIVYSAIKPFKPVRRLGSGLGGDIEPRWDPVTPDVLYAFPGTALVSCDVRTGRITTLHDFKKDVPKSEFACTNSEGEPSEDFRWWTILAKDANGKPLAVFCYDKAKNAIISKKTQFEYPVDKAEVNWVSTCPLSGDPVIGWNYRPETDETGSKHWGAIRYDKQWRKIADTMADGHCDFAIGPHNEELLVYQNNSNDAVEMVNLSNGKRTKLFDIPFPFAQGSTLGLHFSGNIGSRSPNRGWVLVVGDEPHGKNNSWLSNHICLVELKENPRIWRLAQTRNYFSEHYFTEVFATLTRDGRRVYFQSNWGNKASSSGEPGRFTEEYVLELPKDWYHLFQ